MERLVAFAPLRSTLRMAVIAAAILPFAALETAASAQTLTDPVPQAKRPAAQSPAKSQSVARRKSCGAYGAGFVAVPGTDACVKIGGWATVEGSAGR